MKGRALTALLDDVFVFRSLSRPRMSSRYPLDRKLAVPQGPSARGSAD
jgi:hypothetical protein